MTYTEFINSIKESRENKWFEYSERHHVIPRCLGGSDDEDNLIYLTYREHFIAHKLLMEENPNNRDLILAVHLMSFNEEREVTPEEYAEARKRFSDSQRGNTFGSLCRHTEEFKENLRERNRKGLSEESRRKIAEARTGTTASEETRRKMSEARLGKPMPPRKYNKVCQDCGIDFLANGSRSRYCPICDSKRLDEYNKTRRTQSEAAKQRIRYPHSKETKKKISEALSGKSKGPMPEEVKRKISETLTGRIMPQSVRDKHKAENLSEDTRRRMSESHRKYK